jgi:predicted acyltransferase
MDQTAQPATPRLISLDVFRGATIALMVLVNNSGDGAHTYAPLQHSEWNGWTLTDTVFPAFLWIVGVVLGLVVYAYPLNLSTQRLLGVLQRIAICYLIASAIYLTTGVRGQLIWIVSLLAGYWIVMKLVPVPGYGAGDLDVGHNLANYIDKIVLGSHNYASTKTWDPEGIVSTLPSIATALFGIMAGHILRMRRQLAERTAWLFLIGNVLIAVGLVAAIWLPINKKLWTSSFSVFMAGLDFVVFAICLWLVDGCGFKRAVKPLIIVGMNAITVYMISELLDEALSALHWRDRLFHAIFAPLASPMNASLLYAMAYTLLLWLVALGMYRRGWFWRV